MFFFLSKILSFLISPFTYLFALIVWAFFSKNSRRQKKLLSFALIFTFFFGNQFILDEFVRMWEPPFVKKELKDYDLGIVLSGMIVYDAKNDLKRFNSNVDRLLQTLPLLEDQKIKNLVFTGGSGDLYNPENKEAKLLEEYLKSVNWDLSNFIFESESRNTYENALFTKEILEKQHPHLVGKKILLITSSMHMRRSIACFEKQGFELDYYSTNNNAGPRKFQFEHCFIPSSSAFSGWAHLGHEIIGYLTYKITGRI